jgi:SAM-dependent methyltransferase
MEQALLPDRNPPVNRPQAADPLDPILPAPDRTRDSIAAVVAGLARSGRAGERWLGGYAGRKVRMDHLYEAALPLIPAGTKVLDLGCGVGLLGLLLEARGLGNETFGIEWDRPKARFARRLAEGKPAIRVVCGDLWTEAWPECAVVSALDVLHYFAPERQRALLLRIGAHLPAGGRLLLRVMDGRAGGMARVTRFCEQLAVGFGWNQAPSVHWRSLAEVHGDLREAGLSILPAPGGGDHGSGNCLLVGEKPGTPQVRFG